MSSFISAIRCAAISCRRRWSSIGILRISSLLLSPIFLACSNMTVPKTTIVVLRCLFSTSAARVMTVVFPTPGMPTTTARLWFSAKHSRQTGHGHVYLFLDQRLVVADHNVDHKQKDNTHSDTNKE